MAKDLKDLIEAQIELGGLSSVFQILEDIADAESQKPLKSYKDAGNHSRYRVIVTHLMQCKVLQEQTETVLNSMKL